MNSAEWNDPLRSEKNTNWEGAYAFRNRAVARQIKSGTLCNEIMAHLTGCPLCWRSRRPDIKDKC